MPPITGGQTTSFAVMVISASIEVAEPLIQKFVAELLNWPDASIVPPTEKLNVTVRFRLEPCTAKNSPQYETLPAVNEGAGNEGDDGVVGEVLVRVEDVLLASPPPQEARRKVQQAKRIKVISFFKALLSINVVMNRHILPLDSMTVIDSVGTSTNGCFWPKGGSQY